MTMHDYQLTIGLFDKDTKIQEIATVEAVNLISDTLITKYDLYAFTLIECHGVYRMDDGSIVREPSIRIEIATENNIDDLLYDAIEELKTTLNQESIMYKKSVSDIDFI